MQATKKLTKCKYFLKLYTELTIEEKIEGKRSDLLPFFVPKAKNKQSNTTHTPPLFFGATHYSLYYLYIHIF